MKETRNSCFTKEGIGTLKKTLPIKTLRYLKVASKEFMYPLLHKRWWWVNLWSCDDGWNHFLNAAADNLLYICNSTPFVRNDRWWDTKIYHNHPLFDPCIWSNMIRWSKWKHTIRWEASLISTYCLKASKLCQEILKTVRMQTSVRFFFKWALQTCQ